MAQALIFNGTAGRVDIPTKIGGGARRLLLVDFLSVSDYGNRCLIGNDLGGNSNSLRFVSATSLGFRLGGLTARTVALSEPLPTAAEYTLEVFVDAAPAVVVHKDGVEIGRQAITNQELNEIVNFQYIGQCGNSFRLSATVKRMIVIDAEYLNASGDGTETTWGDGTLNGLTPPGCWTPFSSGSTPISFTGNIANQTFNVGDSVNIDLSSNWSGTQTPFTFAVTTGLLAGTGLTLSSSGVLSGTATLATQTGIVITGTDADTNTAVSNSFSVTVNAAPTAITAAVAFTMPQMQAAIQGQIVGADPIFTSEPLRDNTNGNLLANEALDYVALYDNTTGALVLRVTGLSTNASGVFSVQNAALTAGVTYKVDWKITSQAEARMPAKAAV